jgi:hypothetical protein
MLVLIFVAFSTIALAQTGAGPLSINGELNEEIFPGASVGARVNAAVLSCGTTVPCIVFIPNHAVLGKGWTTPLPNNVLLDDRRGTNSQGFASGSAPGLKAHVQYNIALGADLPFEEDEGGSGRAAFNAEVSAYDGGHPGDAGKANAVAALLYAERIGGSRPIWGQNINFQYSNQKNQAYGLEIDSVNNSGADDPGSGSIGAGEVIIASGAKKMVWGLLFKALGRRLEMILL